MSLRTNLISYYRLDESSGDARDAFGGNHLTNVGTTPYNAGKINNGATFDNSNNRRLAAGNAVGFTSGGAMTWNFWFKPAAQTGYMFDVITNSGAQKRLTVYLNGTNVALYTWNTDFDSATAVSNGTWAMATLTYNNGSIELFINGVSKVTGTAGTSAGSANDFSIGAGYGDFGAKYNGMVDEVGVWSRVLTGAEITSLYNSGNATQYPFGLTDLLPDASTPMSQTIGTTHTFSHTMGTGVNGILFVGATVHIAQTVTGITYNGVAMTSVGSKATASAITYLFYLLAPATGANNVVVTSSLSDTITASSMSFTGAKQSGQPDASSTGGVTTTTAYSQAVTTIADNCWTVFVGIANGGSALTKGAATIILNQPEVLAYGMFTLQSSDLTTPAGTSTLAVTSASQGFSGVMASISPVLSQIFTKNFKRQQAPYRAANY